MMRVGIVFSGILGILACAAALPLDAREPERLVMKVSPTVSFAPANLVVRASIEADSDNRAVEIVAESSDFYRSSEVQLDGDRAPRTNMFEFRSLPSGTYEVTGILIGSNGRERAIARQQVNVMAGGQGH